MNIVIDATLPIKPDRTLDPSDGITEDLYRK